jgi:hypothetical protein
VNSTADLGEKEVIPKEEESKNSQEDWKMETASGKGCLELVAKGTVMEKGRGISPVHHQILRSFLACTDIAEAQPQPHR